MPLPILQILSTGDGTRAMYAIRSATLKWKEVRAPLAASQKQDYPIVATAYAAPLRLGEVSWIGTETWAEARD
jgi:hypothetical protein